ncbi:MAG: penicillin-binding protein 2 [Desulfatitalea sp.]|nr:penicillin-binding protein 2 [Desulfatitalea sp.]
MKNVKRHTIRVALVSGCFLLWLVVIAVTAGYYQLFKADWLSRKAEVQYEHELTINGKRGAIYDSRHEVMAVSVETTSIAAYTKKLKDKPAAAAQLAKVLRLNAKEVKRNLNSGRPFVWIKRQATPNEVAAVKQLGLKGIDFLSEYSRFYPNTTLAAQVLGFTGIDGQGLEGIESFYERDLKGAEKRVTVLRDALGRDTDRLATTSQTGSNLVLTIDRHIQFIAEQALAEAVTEYKGRSGMALVMDPGTGAVLAMAHYPFFNPNAYSKSDRTVWRNRAVSDAFEPGSTMKIFSAAAALEDGNIRPNSIFFCENGNYIVGGHKVHDTKPHGWLTLQQIVKFSSNIGAVKLVEQLGSQTLHANLREFGFGRRTGIDSNGEAAGSLSDYKSWTKIDAGAIAFGQGVAATALQVLSATAAIANDGVMMRPYLVQAVTDAQGRSVRAVKPESAGRVLSARTAETLRTIMRAVVTEGGTGVKADVNGYSVCGKTGTAQKLEPGGEYSEDRYVASFVGFAPAERPAVAVLVVVDEPQGTIYGGLVAAPAFSRIVKETLGYMNVPPSNDWQKLQVSREIKIDG